MAEVLAADAAREVDVGAAVVGLHPGAFGADDDERRRRPPLHDARVQRSGAGAAHPWKGHGTRLTRDGGRQLCGVTIGGRLRARPVRREAAPVGDEQRDRLRGLGDGWQVHALVDPVLALGDRAEADRGRVAVELEGARVGRRRGREQRRPAARRARRGVDQPGDQRRVGRQLVALALEALVEHLDRGSGRGALAATRGDGAARPAP